MTDFKKPLLCLIFMEERLGKSKIGGENLLLEGVDQGRLLKKTINIFVVWEFFSRIYCTLEG